MPKFYLPLKHIVREPTTGRQVTLLIPGAEQMDGSQLDEIIQWQEEKTLAELKRPIPKRTYSREEVGKALNEFNKELRKRRQSSHNRLIF
uniref:Uncharacterized protein n=1 Tax=viral metagenome TaxID=1070528 RepID=A0A6M3LHK8_9ZZZZ